MKIWISTVSLVVVCMTLTACSTSKEDAPGKSENNTESEQKPQEAAKPADPWPSQQPPNQEPPVQMPPETTLDTPDGDQVDDTEVTPPKSRVFGAIGRAFFGGATSRDSDDPESLRDPFDEENQ